MNKTITLFVALFSINFSLSSQSLDNWSQDIDPETNLSFLNGKMQIILVGDPPIQLKTNYNLNSYDSVPFLSFNFDNDSQSFLPKPFTGANKWLVLFYDCFLFAYDADDSLPIRNGIKGPNSHKMMHEYTYQASSSLQEKNTIYSANNLGNLSTKKPWVEGVPGYGIGEYVLIKKESGNTKFESILISIGFVSYKTPSLYSQNSRPKTIELTNENKTINIEVTLADTPNLQSITLPMPTDNLKITIKDIYKGTKWDDTCINFIIPLSWHN